MIRVILKDGRVLDYNNAQKAVRVTNGFMELQDDKQWYAQINPDVIERIEYEIKPCRISKDRRDKKKMKFYL